MSQRISSESSRVDGWMDGWRCNNQPVPIISFSLFAAVTGGDIPLTLNGECDVVINK